MPIIGWLLYADHELAPICRSVTCAVALHFTHYNFARIHKTLRVTPAMQAGISDRV